MRKGIRVVVSIGVVGLLVAGYFVFRRYDLPGFRSGRVMAWIKSPEQHPDWAVAAGIRCGTAPFILPTSGYIGYLWGDSFRIGQRHQGIDIFGGTPPGQTSVEAAYSGYLTRLADWKSSLIIRIPSDPLQPGRQIWTYYTHLADPTGNSLIDPAFPPGTREVYIATGTRLGVQGNYSGDPTNPVGVHLHFSIVRDNGKGNFLDERQIGNTVDPSPYLGLNLNASQNKNEVPRCP